MTSLKKSKQYLAGILFAGMLSIIPVKGKINSSNNLENKLGEIKKEVKEDPSGYSFYGHNPDTVYVKELGRGKIKSGKEWTAIQNNGKQTNAYFYDFGNDGKVDRVIFSSGKLSEDEKSKIETDALTGDMDSWSTMLDLNDTSIENKGKTPYNTRRVFSINPKRDRIDVYNFGSGEKFSGKKEEISKVQNLYEKVIDNYSKNMQ